MIPDLIDFFFFCKKIANRTQIINLENLNNLEIINDISYDSIITEIPFFEETNPFYLGKNWILNFFK